MLRRKSPTFNLEFLTCIISGILDVSKSISGIRITIIMNSKTYLGISRRIIKMGLSTKGRRMVTCGKLIQII